MAELEAMWATNRQNNREGRSKYGFQTPAMRSQHVNRKKKNRINIFTKGKENRKIISFSLPKHGAKIIIEEKFKFYCDHDENENNIGGGSWVT